jgi:serine/threonine protein kinase
MDTLHPIIIDNKVFYIKLVMSINNLIFIGSGSFGIIMRTILDDNICVVKQSHIILDDETSSHENEVLFTKTAYNYNNDFFIKIIKDEINAINLAKTINIDIPKINSNSFNDFGYIYMEYMEQGDLYSFLKEYNYYDFDISGILGSYFSGLYILHNELKIIHGDITPMNILVQYMGPNFKQKINYNGTEYNINTSGYCFKIADFGLANYIDDTRYNKNNKSIYINHIYRDYLLLFFLYFYNDYFINYNMFSNIIDITIEKIKDDITELYSYSDEYKKYFIDKYCFNNMCYFMSKYLETKNTSSLYFDTPRILLVELLEIIGRNN